VMLKVFAIPVAWIEEGSVAAVTTVENLVLEESVKFFRNPRLSQPGWFELQDGTWRVCVEIEHDGALSPEEIALNLSSTRGSTNTPI
jgi:hypothetical protein